MNELIEELKALLNRFAQKEAELNVRLSEADGLRLKLQQEKKDLEQQKKLLDAKEKELKKREANVLGSEELAREKKKLEEEKTAFAKKVEAVQAIQEEKEKELNDKQAKLDAWESNLISREQALEKEKKEYRQRIKREVLLEWEQT